MPKPRTKAELVKMLNEGLKKDLENMDAPKPRITYHQPGATHGEADKTEKSRKQRREQNRELKDSRSWDL